ncbi:MAG TPA: hypothetical protein VLC98_00425 [Phnomibacter sp.]|nr:hypothetical protein [Phnomibacter sp.]
MMRTTRLLCIAVVLLLPFGKLLAQEKTIVQVLNSQLQKELKQYPKIDSFVLLQPYQINEKKELSFKFKKINESNGNMEIVTRTVNLKMIRGLVKDINVLFETEGDAVTILTSTVVAGGKIQPATTDRSDLFFTEIKEEKGNEDFRDKLLAAFKKAGYKIECTIWAD